MYNFDDEFKKIEGVKFPLGSGYYSAAKWGFDQGVSLQQQKIDQLNIELNTNKEAGQALLNNYHLLQEKIKSALEELKYPTASWEETVASVISVLEGDDSLK